MTNLLKRTDDTLVGHRYAMTNLLERTGDTFAGLRCAMTDLQAVAMSMVARSYGLTNKVKQAQL